MLNFSLSQVTDLALFGGRAAILVLAFLTFAWAFGRWRRSARVDTQRLFEQLDVTLYELREVSERVQGLESRINGLNERIEREAPRAPAVVAQKGYDVAVRLAKNGLSVDELITNCGVARHEAELLVRLHSKPRIEPRREPVAAATVKTPSQIQMPRVPQAERAASNGWPLTSVPAQRPPVKVSAQPPQAAPAPVPKPALRRRGSLVSVMS
jgi:Protein of unknown function (DUF2802)